jgi:hypothetical protein
MRCRIIVSVALAVGLAPPLSAQALDSLTLEATVGASLGSGGRQPYANSGGIAGEVIFAVRPHPDRAAAWLGALTVGGRGQIGHGDLCRVLPDRPGCAPDFPNFGHVGLLAGREWRWPMNVDVRALAGPAYYGGDGPSGVGAQLHIDAASGFTHLALVGAVRGSWVVRVTGEMLFCRNLEFGLRVQ